MRRAAVVGAVILGAALVITAPAEAAGAACGAQCIANNIKGILIGVAASIYIGIVVIVALKFLPGRHYVELGVFLLAAVVIGGIVLMPDQTVSTVKDIFRSVTKG